MSVVISDGRITAIGAAARIKAPLRGNPRRPRQVPDSRSLEYACPSWCLCDGKRALSGFLAEGITGVRTWNTARGYPPIKGRRPMTGRFQDPQWWLPAPSSRAHCIPNAVFISVKEVAAAVQRSICFTLDAWTSSSTGYDSARHLCGRRNASETRPSSFRGHIPPTVLPEGFRFWSTQYQHLEALLGVLIGSSAREPELHALEVQMYQDILTALGTSRCRRRAICVPRLREPSLKAMTLRRRPH